MPDLPLTETEISAVRAPLEKAALLPARVYSDPAIFQLERERLFPASWLPVCHVSDLDKPGDFVTRHLFGEPILAVRTRDGEIRVMSNVCRHRNTTLLTGSGTCKGNRISCPYHGWTYGLDGQLLAAPFMDRAEDFVRKDIRLPELRFEEWHGFVFVNLDGNAPPLAEALAGLEASVAPYRFEDMEKVELKRTRVGWNWKVSIENFSEAYHQPWVHPVSAEKDFPADKAEYIDTNNAYSVFLLHQAKGEEFPLFCEPVPGIAEEFRRFVTVYNIYPYFHSLTDAATPLLLDLNVFTENDHELVWSLLMPKGSKASPDLEEKLAQFRAFIEPIMTEDVEVCSGIAEGVQSRFTGQGRLSHMEKALHQFHNWWLDMMLESSR